MVLITAKIGFFLQHETSCKNPIFLGASSILGFDLINLKVQMHQPIKSKTLPLKVTWNLSFVCIFGQVILWHDEVIKWKHFPCYWPFVRGIHRSPVASPCKGQWSRALMFSFTCTWKNGSANNRDASDLRCHYAHYNMPVIEYKALYTCLIII